MRKSPPTSWHFARPIRVARITCLIRQSHDKCQSYIESCDIAVVEVTDLPANACAPNRDRFVGHHVRSCAKAVSRGGLDGHSKVLSLVTLRSHLANHHRCVLGRKRIGLDDHRRSRFAIVPCRRNSYDVPAPHRSSNSATASIHFIASSSRVRSRAATSRAIRRRTALDLASGTTKRNSRKPRSRRRSRMAFMRSAASGMGESPYVTRYIVTRYIGANKDI